MKITTQTFVGRFVPAVFLLISLHAQSWAQGVFKCSVAGKTVYQSSPCSGQGKELEIAPGPSEQQMKEAKTRADAEKARAGTYQAPSAQKPEDQLVVQKVDCAKLNNERAEAFGRRNATIRQSRATNIDQSSAVDRYYEDIRRIESQMVKGGCKPT